MELLERVVEVEGEVGRGEGEQLRHTFPLSSFLGGREAPWNFPVVISWWSWWRGWEGGYQSFPPNSGEEARKGPNMVELRVREGRKGEGRCQVNS